jgi:hypothetical protein
MLRSISVSSSVSTSPTCFLDSPVLSAMFAMICVLVILSCNAVTLRAGAAFAGAFLATAFFFAGAFFAALRVAMLEEPSFTFHVFARRAEVADPGAVPGAFLRELPSGIFC